MKFLTNNAHWQLRTAKHQRGNIPAAAVLSIVLFLAGIGLSIPAVAGESHATAHKTIEIDGVEVFYREAGPVDAPTLLLLHGFPTSSHMFRNLIPALSDRFTWWRPTTPASEIPISPQWMNSTTASMAWLN